MACGVKAFTENTQTIQSPLTLRLHVHCCDLLKQEFHEVLTSYRVDGWYWHEEIEKFLECIMNSVERKKRIVWGKWSHCCCDGMKYF